MTEGDQAVNVTAFQPDGYEFVFTHRRSTALHHRPQLYVIYVLKNEGHCCLFDKGIGSLKNKDSLRSILLPGDLLRRRTRSVVKSVCSSPSPLSPHLGVNTDQIRWILSRINSQSTRRLKRTSWSNKTAGLAKIWSHHSDVHTVRYWVASISAIWDLVKIMCICLWMVLKNCPFGWKLSPVKFKSRFLIIDLCISNFNPELSQFFWAAFL